MTPEPTTDTAPDTAAEEASDTWGNPGDEASNGTTPAATAGANADAAGDAPVSPTSSLPDTRLLLRSVAIPAEHGGWGLTLEPVVLGLLTAASWAGGLIGLAALLAFLVRKPAKLVAVDTRRGRRLPRTDLAALVAGIESALLLGAAATATWLRGATWLWPVVAALPLLATQARFDTRSRSRRLLPELAGAVAVSASSASIVIAGGETARLGVGLWLVLAARAIGAVPSVRAQIIRSRGMPDPASLRASDIAQIASVLVAGAAVVLDRQLLFGLAGVAALAIVQATWTRRTPPVPKRIGIRQMLFGLALVVVTGLGITVL